MNKTRVVLYVRVSGHEQATEGYSVGEQTERLRSYAAAMDWTVVRILTDPGFTGSNMDRPALKELIGIVKAGQVDKVVVYKLDRLSRSQKDTLYLIEDVFLKNNVDFVSLSENFDTSTAFGRAVIGLLAVFAQLEREQIRERMIMGREARAKDGYYTAGLWTLTGYDYKDGELVVNEYEAMVVREIFRLFVAGKTLRGLAAELNRRGLYCKSSKWQDTALARILSNRHYIGEVKFSRKWYPGRHEAIIDRETFDAAQKMLRLRSESKLSTNKPTTALSGFCFCGKCGARYHKVTRHPKKDGTRREVFECYSRSHATKKMSRAASCDNKIYEVGELERLVFGEIRKLAVDPEYLRTLSAPREEADGVKTIREEIAALSSKISHLMDLYSIDRLTLEEVDRKIAPLADKRTLLENELEALQDKTALPVEEAEELILSFGDVLDRGSLDEIRLVLSALIERIEITGDDITIFWRFA